MARLRTARAPVWGRSRRIRLILPLNSRIRVEGAGPYSGVYSVEDTGPKVAGRHIDIYMNTLAEVKKFGKKTVRVVLRYGDNEPKRRSFPEGFVQDVAQLHRTNRPEQ